MSIFKGSGVALVTPMKENGEINYDSLERLIEDQIKNGTDALVVVGTSGEAPTLDDPEHLEAIRFSAEVTKGRIPVVAGTGSNNTAHAVMMSEEAEKLGADGLLLVGVDKDDLTRKVGNRQRIGNGGTDVSGADNGDTSTGKRRGSV